MCQHLLYNGCNFQYSPVSEMKVTSIFSSLFFTILSTPSETIGTRMSFSSSLSIPSLELMRTEIVILLSP